MFKNLLSWLTGNISVDRWILILALLGMLYFAILYATKNKKGSGENG